MMRLMLVQNNWSGRAELLDLSDGMTVGSLFAQKNPGRQPDQYLFRVNQDTASADRQLREGDRVSFTPLHIEGA